MDDLRHDERYRARGVSAAKGDVHAAIRRQDAGLFPGAFCKIIPDDLTGAPDHCLVMHADGAGTKSALAYLAWREGLDERRIWAGIAQDSLVMNLDDCACVGALGPFIVSNAIGRNAKRIPGPIIAAIVDGYQQVCDLLGRFGILCRLSGGETADVGDVVRTILVDSTVMARLPRTQVIDAQRIAPGDAIVGFSSTGQAAWEQAPSSGIGANGLTGARHELLHASYAATYPESFAPEIPSSLVYSGRFRLQDTLPGAAGMTVGEALLSPTRTYVPLIADLVRTLPVGGLHALIHCSGGGQSKIVGFGGRGRAQGLRYRKHDLFPTPPLFAALQAASGRPWAEMYGVYNMGHRLEAVVPPELVAPCIARAEACGIAAQRIGTVEERDAPGNEVVIDSPAGTFVYR